MRWVHTWICILQHIFWFWVLILGEFNVEIEEEYMNALCDNYNLFKQLTCYKSRNNPTCIDLILSNTPIISDNILWEFQKVCLKISPPPYTMLPTYNIAWRKFWTLFLNIFKKGKGAETRDCPISSFSHNFFHWFSEKI